MSIKYSLLIFSFLFNLTIVAQTTISLDNASKKVKKCFKKAEKAQKEKKYDKAIEKYQEVLKKEPALKEAKLGLAVSLLNANRKQEAIPILESLQEDHPNYEVKIAYTLYSLHTENDNYTKAYHYINNFYEALTPDDKRRQKIEKSLRQAFVRDSLSSSPVPFDLIALDSNINSTKADFLPAVVADGSQLIFTRGDKRQEDFFIAHYDEQGAVINVEAMVELNTNQSEGAHCISQDGKLFIFTACNRPGGKGSCDLYYALKQESGWSKPMNLGSQINTEFWESQPSLSSDGRLLYFSSRREGGFGGKDIWISTLENQRWQAPINLGSVINTPGDEASPFIHPDNKTLYFRSNKHEGMGGFDIFFSRKQNGQWTSVQNIGYPINTKNDEGALFVTLNGDQAYYASDHLNEKNKNWVDIYSFEIPISARPAKSSYVKFRVSDSETNEALRANLTIIDVSNSDTIYTVKADKKGELLTTLSEGTDFAIYLDKEGYVFHSESASFNSVKLINPIIKEIKLQKIQKDQPTDIGKEKPIVLNNIFFESGSAVLLETSSSEITKLAELLRANPSMMIKISGHTDNIGQELDNQKLSLQRAQSVRLAITNLGVQSSRIEAEGMGESSPISDNETEEGRRLNRRTEFVILR